MRLLVTRPAVDAAPLVTALEARGHDALVQPLLSIEPVAPEPPLDLAGVQALLFTSANGVRAFAGASSERGLPVFAVGDATAEAARTAGFAEVESAKGDVQDLAHLVGRRLDPAAGPLLHGAGGSLAGDLQGDLKSAGFSVWRSVLYTAEPVRQLAEPVRAALAEGRLDAVLFFSPRTAKSFVRLVADHDLAAACERCRAVCLSQAVADALGALSWEGVHVAARANQQALLDCLDALDRDAAAPGPEGNGRGEIMAEEGAAQGPKHGEGHASGVITAFGGIRPMAHKLGLAVSTVQGWKERDAIPANRHAQVLAAAETHGIALGEADFAALGGSGAQFGPEAAPAAERPLEVEILPPLEPDGEPEPETIAPQGPAHEAAAPPPRPSRRLAGFALASAILALLAVGLFVTRGLWYPAAEEDAEQAVAAAVEAPAPAETPPQAREQPVPSAEPPEAEALDTAPAAEAPPAPLEPEAAQQPPAESPAESLAPIVAEPQQTIVPPETTAEVMPGPGRVPESLTAVLDELSTRLGRLEEAAAAPVVSADQLALLTAEQEALAVRLAAVESRLASLDRIEREIEGLTRPAGPPPTSGDVALMIALAQLGDVLARGDPYAAELELLRGVIAGAPMLTGLLAPLEAHVAAGAPTRAALERDFSEVARAVVAGSVGGESPGLVAGMLRRLSDVVTVRPVGEVEGEDAGALVARAEHRLEAGDLAGALVELDGLGGAAAEAAADWRAGAEARLAVEAALAALRAQAVAGLLLRAGG
jgi:uroporphyrinogen-III synthase